LTLEANGKIGMLGTTCQFSAEFLTKFTQVLEELGLRGNGLINGLLDNVAIPSPSLEFAQKFQDLKSKFNYENELLYKFGCSKYLSKYSFKVALASSYERYTNVSIQDSELCRQFTPPPSDITIHCSDGNNIRGIRDVKINFSTNWDYYIFCTSHRLDFRLFNDFEADCVLVIKDRIAFSNALGSALNKIVQLEQMEYGLIKYFDPIRCSNQKEPDVQFCKHFKYSYQGEHRHVFTPRFQHTLKDEIFIELPEVSEYSELVTI
jgi:hypothetical protein